MRDSKESAPGATAFDWLLIAINVALLCGGVFYVLTSPKWWCWCLGILDVRDWTHWTWTGIAVALLAALWLVRACARPAATQAGRELPDENGDRHRK